MEGLLVKAELIYAALFKIIEQREGVKITFSVKERNMDEDIRRDNELCGCSNDTGNSRGK